MWYFRNALWRQVIVEQHQDLCGWFQEHVSEFVLEEDRFWSRCRLQALWKDQEVVIVWRAGFWWETCNVSFQGIEHCFEDGISISQIQDILRQDQIEIDEPKHG